MSVSDQLQQVEYYLFRLIEELESSQLNLDELTVLANVRAAFSSIQQARKGWE